MTQNDGKGNKTQSEIQPRNRIAKNFIGAAEKSNSTEIDAPLGVLQNSFDDHQPTERFDTALREETE